MTAQPDVVPDWHRRLAAEHQSACSDGCLGTVRHIDAAARLRGAAAVTEGGCATTAAPISAGRLARSGGDRSNFALDPHAPAQGNLTVGTDSVETHAPSLANTPPDALTHLTRSQTSRAGKESIATWE